MNIQNIGIIGAGGFGLEVAMLIEQINFACSQWNLIGFFDDVKKMGEKINDHTIIGGTDKINSWESSLAIVVAVANPSLKMKIVKSIYNKNIFFPTLIHPSAIVGNKKYVTIGEGSIICANNILTTNISIGRHTIINLGCTIGHETFIGDFSSFMPNCNISGGVSIDDCTYWGTGSIIINNLKVGKDSIIGAGTVVVRDVPSKVTVVGVPAKIIKIKDSDRNRADD